jgi:hypothetical protein
VHRSEILKVKVKTRHRNLTDGAIPLKVTLANKILTVYGTPATVVQYGEFATGIPSGLPFSTNSRWPFPSSASRLRNQGADRCLCARKVPSHPGNALKAIGASGRDSIVDWGQDLGIVSGRTDRNSLRRRWDGSCTGN